MYNFVVRPSTLNESVLNEMQIFQRVFISPKNQFDSVFVTFLTRARNLYEEQCLMDKIIKTF